MEFEDFKNRFTEKVEGIDRNEISESANIIELDGWDSLTYMSMTVMIEEDYGVELSQDEFNSIDTMGDLFEFVKKYR